MKLILSASGWGQNADDFAESIRNFLKNSELSSEEYVVDPIKWQIDIGPQKIVDFFDARSGKKVILEIAQKLIQELQIASENDIDVFIVSYSAGSRLIEESLSLVKGIGSLNVKLQHIMFAPAINETEWANVGKIASSALALGLGGLIAAKSKGKTRIASALLGVLGGIKLLKRDTVMDKLSVASEENNLQYAKINRYIFYSPIDERIRDIPLDIPGATYYAGSFSHSEIGDLGKDAMSQEFKYKKWLMEHEEPKIHLLTKILD